MLSRTQSSAAAAVACDATELTSHYVASERLSSIVTIVCVCVRMCSEALRST